MEYTFECFRKNMKKQFGIDYDDLQATNHDSE